MYIYIFTKTNKTRVALNKTSSLHRRRVCSGSDDGWWCRPSAVKFFVHTLYFFGVCMHHVKRKEWKNSKNQIQHFIQRKGPSSNQHSQRGVEYHRQLNAQKLCRACEDKNDSSLGVVFMQSRSFWTDSSPIVVHENADDDFGDENIFIQSAEQPEEEVFVFLSS